MASASTPASAASKPAEPVHVAPPQAEPAWRRFLVPLVVVLLIAAVVFTLTRNWNAWEGGRAEQVTDDAYVRGDLTPLSTKVAGIVRNVNVSDYQQVHKGDLIVELQDDDFQAVVAQATAAIEAANAAIENNHRQRELQDTKIESAMAGIDQANAEIVAAQAGIEASRADVTRTKSERARQESLLQASSATQQKLEKAVADQERFTAQMASREADLVQAKTLLRSNELAVEAEKQSKAVLESQDVQLVADLHAKQAALTAAKMNFGYTKIDAPDDGTVGERQVRPGQLVSPGTQVISVREQEPNGCRRTIARRNSRILKIGDPVEHSHGRVSGPGVSRESAGNCAGQRIAIRAAAAGQRDRQFHESGATHSGEDRA